MVRGCQCLPTRYLRDPGIATAEEQIELKRHGLARHGDLPDVSRESPMLRPKAMKPKPAALPAAASPRQSPRQYRRGECHRRVPCRKPRGRTSTLESRASDRPPILRCCNGRRRTPRARLLHECKPDARSRDATDKELRERRSHGRSVVSLYNAVRPHSALGARTPDQIYFDQPLLAAA